MRRLVTEAGLGESFELDSAGTSDWHAGEPPDARACRAALRRGIVLEGTARQVRSEDFSGFDLILAMDRSNERELRRLAPNEQARAKVRLLREFDPDGDGDEDLDVPDPYCDGEHGFEVVLDLVWAACEGLLERVREGQRS